MFSNCLKPIVFKRINHFDNRGVLSEVFRHSRNDINVKQATYIETVKNSLRGFHWQDGQSRLLTVLSGMIVDITVDIDSLKTYKNCLLPGDMLYIPSGFAHGCLSLEDSNILYFCDIEYSASDAKGMMWNDPKINADWGISNPILSKADTEWKHL